MTITECEYRTIKSRDHTQPVMTTIAKRFSSTLQKGRWGKKIWWRRLNGRFGARRELNVGYGVISSVTLPGCPKTVATGRSGASELPYKAAQPSTLTLKTHPKFAMASLLVSRKPHHKLKSPFEKIAINQRVINILD